MKFAIISTGDKLVLPVSELFFRQNLQYLM